MVIIELKRWMQGTVMREEREDRDEREVSLRSSATATTAYTARDPPPTDKSPQFKRIPFPTSTINPNAINSTKQKLLNNTYSDTKKIL